MIKNNELRSKNSEKNVERANSSRVTNRTNNPCSVNARVKLFEGDRKKRPRGTILHSNESNCSRSVGTVAYNCYHKLNIQWNLHLVVGPASQLNWNEKKGEEKNKWIGRKTHRHLFTPFTLVLQMIAIEILELFNELFDCNRREQSQQMLLLVFIF